MYTSDYLDIETMWEKLQDFSRAGLYPADYLLLLGALDTGWNVVEPVKVFISSDQKQSGTYLFNLRHPANRHLRYLKIQEHAAIHDLIKEEKWKVVCGISRANNRWPTEIF